MYWTNNIARIAFELNNLVVLLVGHTVITLSVIEHYISHPSHYEFVSPVRLDFALDQAMQDAKGPGELLTGKAYLRAYTGYLQKRTEPLPGSMTDVLPKRTTLLDLILEATR